MTAFHLKIIALVSMLMDHTAAVFPQYVPLWFRVVGRLAFPIFAYLVAEGFRHTRDARKFLLRLAAFALVSQPFFGWALMGYAAPWQVSFIYRTNIFYTMLLGGGAIVAFQQIKSYLAAQKENEYIAAALGCLPLLGFLWLGDFLATDFGAAGVALVFTMYAVQHKKARLATMAVLCVILQRGLLDYWYFVYINPGVGRAALTNPQPRVIYWMLPATLLTVVLAALYNGKREPLRITNANNKVLAFIMKWFFYAAYPAHLAILGGLALFI